MDFLDFIFFIIHINATFELINISHKLLLFKSNLMFLKISASKKNRTIFYICVFIVFPVVYNKLGYRLIWNNLEVWSMGFVWLYLIMSVYLFVSIVYISYVCYCFGKRLENDIVQRNIHLKKLMYYGCAVAPVLLVFIAFTSLWIWDRDEFWDILWMNMIWRISLLTLVMLGIAYLFDKDSAWAIRVYKREIVEVVKEVTVKEEVVKEVIIKHEVIKEIYVETRTQIPTPATHDDGSRLPQKIALNEMYTYLVHVAGIGPLYKDLWMIRFFDIVGVKTQHRQRHVIFSDGSVVLCNHIMRALEEQGLQHWLVKISDNYMINMLLVDFPYYKKGSQLILHTESMIGLQRKMRPEDIYMMLTFGKGISDKKIKVFWENRNSLVHEGWDTWIPIRK